MMIGYLMIGTNDLDRSPSGWQPYALCVRARPGRQQADILLRRSSGL